jgi:hypothetical protein
MKSRACISIVSCASYRSPNCIRILRCGGVTVLSEPKSLDATCTTKGNMFLACDRMGRPYQMVMAILNRVLYKSLGEELSVI